MDSYQYDRLDDEWWIDTAPYPGPYEQPSPFEIMKEFGISFREAAVAFSGFTETFSRLDRMDKYILWPPPEPINTLVRTEYERTKDIKDPRDRALQMKKLRSTGPVMKSKRMFDNDGKRLF